MYRFQIIKQGMLDSEYKNTDRSICTEDAVNRSKKPTKKPPIIIRYQTLTILLTNIAPKTAHSNETPPDPNPNPNPDAPFWLLELQVDPDPFGSVVDDDPEPDVELEEFTEGGYFVGTVNTIESKSTHTHTDGRTGRVSSPPKL
ncbi:hypothetical protein AAF712_002837 [Marasmius tenuissimus]|uniref:Uncharacterized protein n=1 Tax=Marasmius tenuissimus TaxID=585030 RepID=A0ABR3ABJ9_9AGAR